MSPSLATRAVPGWPLVLLFAPGCLAQQPPAPPSEAVLFQPIPTVEAAALHTQSLREAPANVTVISEEDIRKYGYRTLGEALASIRGFYLSYDRAYHYAGLRGFLLPGDYNSRFLVMINGHVMTENVYSSNGFFGQDFGLDLDLVKRIEIIRGPSSALYGTNGIFATINIVTRSPVEQTRATVSTETGSFGERKLHIATASNLGQGANLLLAASAFHNRGQSLYFPEFDAPETNHGWAEGVDSERGYHSFANLIWRDWSVMAYFNRRDKQVPSAWYDTVFNDPGSGILDSRNFVEAAWSHDVGPDAQLRWRIYFDQYLYRGRYDYALEEGISDTRDESKGEWIGSRLTYRFAGLSAGPTTFGAKLNADLRCLQRNFQVVPERIEYLHKDNPDLSVGVFLQQEWILSRRWKAYGGVRLDDSRYAPAFVSPRLALIFQPTPQAAYKFLYGRAFRNPSAFEEFYEDVATTQVANPLLGAEHAHTLEGVVERKLGRRWDLVATAFHYRLDDIIDVVERDDMLQFQNVARNRASGLEVELSGRPAGRVETSASLAWQHAMNPGTAERLFNSPHAVGKLRLAVPAGRKFWLSSAVQYVGARRTLAGALVRPVFLLDATLASIRLHPSADIVLGIRNLFAREYYDPLGVGYRSDRMRGDGRSFFLKLIWRARE